MPTTAREQPDDQQLLLQVFKQRPQAQTEDAHHRAQHHEDEKRAGEVEITHQP
jgi:hypothetical protein